MFKKFFYHGYDFKIITFFFKQDEYIRYKSFSFNTKFLHALTSCQQQSMKPSALRLEVKHLTAELYARAFITQTNTGQFLFISTSTHVMSAAEGIEPRTRRLTAELYVSVASALIMMGKRYLSHIASTRRKFTQNAKLIRNLKLVEWIASSPSEMKTRVRLLLKPHGVSTSARLVCLTICKHSWNYNKPTRGTTLQTLSIRQ